MLWLNTAEARWCVVGFHGHFCSEPLRWGTSQNYSIVTAYHVAFNPEYCLSVYSRSNLLDVKTFPIANQILVQLRRICISYADWWFCLRTDSVMCKHHVSSLNVCIRLILVCFILFYLTKIWKAFPFAAPVHLFFFFRFYHHYLWSLLLKITSIHSNATHVIFRVKLNSGVKG